MLVDVPKDVQIGQTEYEPVSVVAEQAPEEIREKDIEQAIRMIEDAKRPYVYCGGGVVISGASEELQAFAELIDAPIGFSMMGLTAVPYTNPRFLGMIGMHGRYAATLALHESDLLIAVGTRFSERVTGNKAEFTGGRKVLQIDIDPAEIGKNIPVTASIVGNVKTVLAALNKKLSRSEHKEWHERIGHIKTHHNNGVSMAHDRLTPEYVIGQASEKMEPSGVVATDVGQHQMWTTQFYKFRQPRTFITSGGLGAMGFGMGAAIGACIGKGKKKTLLFTSDGSFHMNLNEMATAVTNELPIVIIVLNNHVLGMVRQWQTLFFEGRYSNTALGRKTDFARLADAMGAVGMRATTREEYDMCLKKAFQMNTPVLIDCIIDPDEKVLPMIPPGGSINDIILR